MTITEPTTDDEAVPVEPELCWLNLSDMAPHPDNPRTSLGDLTELTRSIRSHGIIEPLVVLPANDDGVYLIVAGRRRHAAGLRAGITDVPAVVRSMTTVEVIEAGLSENGNRTDLTLSEEVRAIERLMSLDEGVTPAKLCKRIGRSQAWVRSRMAVTILPARWRAALDKGDLSLAAAESAASVADLGPEHLDAVCDRLTGRSWQEPSRIVADYRAALRRADAYDKAVAKARSKHAVVFTDDEPAPDKAKRLGELFDADGCKAHAAEPCHAVVVRARTWGDGVDTWEVCTDPRRHNPSKVGTSGGSDLATDRTPTRPAGTGDDSHAKRKARLARLAHATDTFARPRGGFSQTDLTRLALHGLIREAGQDALKFAATMLGHDDPREVTVTRLLDGVDTHAALVRVAGAVAFGLAENHMYWSSGSPQCRDYLDLLTGTGWEPDDWTANAIARNAARDTFADDDTVTDDDHDDGDQQADDEDADDEDADGLDG
ncbi:MAG: ParB/RepB/Spo0J family partition protein [Microbacteriaceae bacterium]